LKEYAVQKNCCFFQINLPLTKEGVGFHDYTIDKISSNSIFYSPIIYLLIISVHLQKLQEMLKLKEGDDIEAALAALIKGSETGNGDEKTDEENLKFKYEEITK
jgi:hypothetical protein